ncbi:BTB/POZ domain-containing protein [Rhizophagus irregularis DAOM 181602=DAOM 197198]|nr:BTB/POZ domain-containing protein [Rhizophagus irregularis DAOM 181602=DAOM 197198]
MKNQFHYNEKNIPYNFNLIYRAKQIVGGYNPLYWDSRNAWESTYDSLLFSFIDKNDLQNAKVSYSNDNQYSIRNCPSVSPAFGGSIDLFFNNNEWCSNSIQNSSVSSYPEVGMPARFKADDFEVLDSHFNLISALDKYCFDSLALGRYRFRWIG